MPDDRFSSGQSPSRSASEGYTASELVPARAAVADADGVPRSEERMLALLSHVGGFFTAFILPLILWLVQKGRSPFVANQAKEALNFQLFLTLLYVLAVGAACLVAVLLPVPEFLQATPMPAVLFGCILIGVFFLVLLVYEVLLVVLASIAVLRGKWFRYPLILRFIW